MERTSDGIAELALHLSRRLSLDLKSLLSGMIVPKGAVTRLAFKHQAHVDVGSLSAASFIASSLSQAVVAAMEQPYRPLSTDTARLQEEARQLQAGMLGFDGLLALCWSYGIPVIPLPNLPVGVRKMDGAALQVGDRPVIVLAKKKSSRAWLSFILAHEMGHIVKGHLQPGSSIVDISLQETAEYSTESLDDSEEAEADAFALEILGGSHVDQKIATWSRDADPVELAVNARAASSAHGIEAGHFILRQAFNTKRWADAVLALRFLSEDLNPQEALLGHLKQNLKLDLIADDLQDLVSQVTGWDKAA